MARIGSGKLMKHPLVDSAILARHAGGGEAFLEPGADGVAVDGKPAVERHMVRQILPAMQRGQRPAALGSEQWKMQIVSVEVQDVELVRALAHLSSMII